MKRAMIFVAAAMMLAACEPNKAPKPDPQELQPDNSYVYNSVETKINWTGVLAGETATTVYFTAGVPADPNDNLDDVTALVRVTIPASGVGTETALSSCTFAYIDRTEGLNFVNSNLASGAVTAFVTGTNVNVVLNATFTNGKKLALKYVGAATTLTSGTVEPPVNPGRDLNKEYCYNGDTTTIVWTGVGEYKIPNDGVLDYKISINSSVPTDQDKPDVGSTGFIYMYIPQNKIGQTIDLSVKSAVTDGWWIYFNDKKSGKTYLGDQTGTTRPDVASGTLKVEYYPEEYNWRMVYSLDCTFTDGKRLQVQYEGGTHPLPTNVITPPVVPGEGTGTVTFDARAAYNIGWAGYLYNSTKKSYSFALVETKAKTYGSVWQLMDNAVMINVPEELLGQDIDLSITHSVSGRDVWGFAYNDYNSNDINFEGYEDPTAHVAYEIGGNIASGTMKVVKNGDSFTITFTNVRTRTDNSEALWNNHTVNGSYTGTLTDMTSYGAKIFWWQVSGS